MNITKYIFFLLTTFYIIFSSTITAAVMLSPNDLIKVTPATNHKCVEYYTYKSELYCSTTVQSSEPVDPKLKENEKLKIVFDDRPWQLAWGKVDPNSTTIEYIPMGENINQWNELITSQFFPGLQEKVTPKQFAEIFAQQFKDAGYKPIVSFLNETPNQVIVEFRIDQPTNQAHDELQMITKDDKGIYMLHYVIKKADMGQKNREKWVENLKTSTIKK